MWDNERFITLKCDLRENSMGKTKIEDNYLLQEPQDGVTLQVRDILLQISLLLSLISHPVQHLVGKQVCYHTLL